MYTGDAVEEGKTREMCEESLCEIGIGRLPVSSCTVILKRQSLKTAKVFHDNIFGIWADETRPESTE